MPEKKGLKQVFEVLESCGREYNIKEDTLKEAEEIMEEQDATIIGVPRDVFLEEVGIEHPEQKKEVKAGSISYCINKRIRDNPSLRAYGIQVGTAKRGDMFSFKKIDWDEWEAEHKKDE